MDSILKKGVLLVSVTGIMTAFPMVVHAADIDDTQNIPAAESTQILEDCYTSDKTISVKIILYRNKRVSIQIWHSQMYNRFFI